MTRSPRLGVAAVLVLVLGGSATAQQSVPSAEVTESRGLRIVWTVEPQTRDFTAVCGHIYNDQRVTARNVGLLVQGVDGDRVVSRNIPNVAREIVGQSGWQFCGTVVRAPAYRVIVTAVDWDTNVGQ
ncbi:MAG TPA: hypothetical protein VF238_07980 [Methylomirabilota bacterium]